MTSIVLEPRQESHFKRMCEIGGRYRVCMDTSPTGAGKTVLALKYARALDLPILGVMPKSLKMNWRNESTKYGIPVLDLLTYGLLRGTKGRQNNSGLLDRRDGADRLSENGRVMKGDIFFSPTEELKRLIKHGFLLIFDEVQCVKKNVAQALAAQELAIAVLDLDVDKKCRILYCSMTPTDQANLQPTVRVLGIMRAKELVSYDHSSK